jgi:hypothetical protein
MDLSFTITAGSRQRILSQVRVPQNSWPYFTVSDSRLYPINTSDLPTSGNTTAATFTDDTAIFATHEDPATASLKLQATINKIDDGAKKWRIKINLSKSMHITFSLRNQTCPTVQMASVDLPQRNKVKYMAMQLDRRLTWSKHV